MQKDNLQKPGKDNTDLQDSDKDKIELKPEPAKLDLPDVKDIPGQENIKPAPMGDLADDTITSSDEEGDAIFNEDNDEYPNSNVSKEEIDDLEKSADDFPTEDNINLRKAALDNTDDDDTPLNESSFKNNITGTGLDVPGAEDDDENEEIGEEDEENNEYSLGGDNHE